MIPYGKQSISLEDIEAVVNVLNSDFLTQGPVTPKFENSLCNYVKTDYAVAFNSCTSALHVACLALDLGPGDIVWTSPISFVASSNCALYCGSSVDFVDIDPLTYNMCPKALELKLELAEKKGELPKIVIPVHFSGQSCDMKSIYYLSKKYRFKIIEDAAHAIGGSYLNEKIGGCKYSDVTVFSFHPVKVITTAEGGAATTNSKKLSVKMEILRSHGIVRDPKMLTKKKEGEWFYQQIDLGFNYRMSELQAALGNSQLKKIDIFVDKRHKLRERYDKSLKNLPLITPYQDQKSYSAMHLYPIQLELDNLKFDRGYYFRELRKAGIGVNVHYIPIYKQPYYKKFGFIDENFPISEMYYSRALTIPLYPTMSSCEQESVIKTLKKVLV